jgi:hypothetical protein
MKYLIAALLIASSAQAADKATYVGEGRYVCNDCSDRMKYEVQRDNARRMDEDRRERDARREREQERGYRELREKVRSDR